MDGRAKLLPPAGGDNRTQEQLRLDREAGARHVGALHRAQAGPAYVAIVPVDPGYRTMGNYACNQYTRVLSPVRVLAGTPTTTRRHVRAPRQRGLRRHRAARILPIPRI